MEFTTTKVLSALRSLTNSAERAALAMRQLARAMPDWDAPLDLDELDTDLECWHADTVLDEP